MSPQPRQRRGLPIGGQWREQEHPEGDVVLDDSPPALTSAQAERRQRQLAAYEGYVPPVATRISGPEALSTRRTDEWWDNHFVQSEYTEQAVGQIPQMPDDFTPSMTAGRALTGNRHTHRMKYTGSGVQVRMPSATSIRSWDKGHGGTFDVPVSAEYPGGSVQGWVRVTRNGDHWHATGLNFPDNANVHVGEAVSSVLEARRVTTALSDIGNLADRARARQSAGGVPVRPVKSSWIGGMGYNKDEALLVMETTTGRSYGHHISPEVFDALQHAKSPGAAYNQLVKGHAVGAVVERCDVCGRFSSGNHICPGSHNAPEPGIAWAQNDLARSRAAASVAAPPVAPPKPEPAPAPAPPPPPPPRPPAPPIAPEPPSSAATGQHTLRPGEKTIALKEVLKAGGKNPNYAMPGEKPLYGRRGWTMDSADTLQPFTSESYEPNSYTKKFDPAFADQADHNEFYSNGDMGLVRFSGADAAAATSLLKTIPPRAQVDGQNDGPPLRTILEATRDNPGRIEFGGYIAGPDRLDERVSASTVYSYDDTDDPDEAWASASKLLGNHASKPDEVTQEENPWRPGEKSWRFSWD